MKVLIIDDENKARRLLRKLIENHCHDISTIIEASDLEAGVSLIKSESPDIVYLDIEMPKYSGLQIFDFIDEQNATFKIIFTTAYNKYAVEAFKLSATDYLLKPIDPKELKTATDKAILDIKNNRKGNQFEDLKKIFNGFSVNKLALVIPRGMIFISYDDIIFMEADGMYTTIYYNDKSELICKPLKHFTDQLEHLNIFYKPHRSYLVNLKHVTEYQKKDGYHLILSNNKSVPISKYRIDSFLEILETVFKS